MGIINAETTLNFKSSDPLFARIKKRLHSYDAEGLIDDGDFHKHVKFIVEEIGKAVYQECEAVIKVNGYKAKLPNNFSQFFSAYRCTFHWQNTKSINEQKPWIYYIDAELTKECPDECCIQCTPDEGRTKVVIRTYVNGEENCATSRNPRLLRLSPNVKEICTEDCLSQFCPDGDEITVKDGNIITTFNEDSIYIQYYGLAVDKFGLPLIPNNEHVEKAIEYYIYTQLFEEWYWNSTVPDIARMLADVRQQYDFHIGMARYWAKLPSFQHTLQSIRRQRGNRKFYQFNGDRTVS